MTSFRGVSTNYDDDFHLPCYGTIEEQHKAYQVACNLEQDE